MRAIVRRDGRGSPTSRGVRRLLDPVVAALSSWILTALLPVDAVTTTTTRARQRSVGRARGRVSRRGWGGAGVPETHIMGVAGGGIEREG